MLKNPSVAILTKETATTSPIQIEVKAKGNRTKNEKALRNALRKGFRKVFLLQFMGICNIIGIRDVHYTFRGDFHADSRRNSSC